MRPPDRGASGSGVVTGLVIGLVIAAAIGVLTGVLTGEDSDTAVLQAQETIEANYFEAVEPTELEDASIAGMVREIKQRYEDRFSHYFTADQLEDFEAATSGSFTGVGLTVSEIPKGLRVATVYPDTPAEEAGLQEGDLITAVDGKTIAGVSSEVSTARIKGPPGSEVEITVEPVNGGRANDLTLERAEVRIPAVDGEIRRTDDGREIAYVRFATFSEGAHGELRETVDRLYRAGAEGLIIDLRGNGGGLLNEAVLSSSIFVEDGEVVSTRSRTRGERSYEAVGEAIDPRPTVVLVNRDTASASEILTAALEVYDLAEVVGTRTFGKGTFQEVLPLEAGGALDLTIGQYLTADGTSLAGKGILPDVRVEDDPKTEEDDEAFERAAEVLARELDAESSS